MKCWILGSGCAFAILLGCGQSHRPEVRRADDARETQHAEDPEPPSNPHAATASPHSPAFAPEGKPSADFDPNAREVEVGKVRMVAPDGWDRKPPGNFVIQAEFRLPRAEGDPADGRLTVSTAGGDIENNVARWRGQFQEKPQKDLVETIDVAGLEVTLVDFSGTFDDSRSSMGSSESRAREAYRMLGAIIPVEGRLHFVKCYGPLNTINAHADAFVAFVRGLTIADD